MLLPWQPLHCWRTACHRTRPAEQIAGINWSVACFKICAAHTFTKAREKKSRLATLKCQMPRMCRLALSFGFSSNALRMLFLTSADNCTFSPTPTWLQPHASDDGWISKKCSKKSILALFAQRYCKRFEGSEMGGTGFDGTARICFSSNPKTCIGY
jgi:hypothetical protein